VHTFKTRTPTIPQVEEAIKAKRPGGEIWDIEPGIARWILDTVNKNNRPKKTSNIKKLAIAMQEGTWRFTGDSLKFGDDGLLRDGQNRLSACTKAGTNFTTIVVFGIPIDAFDAMDTGVSRNARDIFKLDSVVNYGTMASAAQWMAALSDGNPLTDRSTRTPQELLKRFKNDWPGLELSYTDDVKRVARLGHPLGMLVAMHYRFSRQDRVLADAYFRTWASGVNEMRQKSNPVLVMRDEIASRIAHGLGRIHDRDRPLLMEHAWLAFRDRRTLAANRIDGLGAKTPGVIWPTDAEDEAAA
jgi:hypothetical protein